MGRLKDGVNLSLDYNEQQIKLSITRIIHFAASLNCI